MSKECGRVPPPTEVKPQPYSLASRFATDQASEQAYFECQQVLDSHAKLALSSFRLQLRRLDTREFDWYVAIIGEHPPAEYHEKFQRILSAGEQVTLPFDVVNWLQRRREEAAQIGPRVEGHYRPGLPRRIR